MTTITTDPALDVSPEVLGRILDALRGFAVVVEAKGVTGTIRALIFGADEHEAHFEQVDDGFNGTGKFDVIATADIIEVWVL